MNGRKKKLAEGQEGGHHVCSPKRAVFVRVFVCLWCLWFVVEKATRKRKKPNAVSVFFFCTAPKKRRKPRQDALFSLIYNSLSN